MPPAGCDILKAKPGVEFSRKRSAVEEVSAVAMPTLLLVEGYRFHFFSNESQEPPHVHVRKGGGFAKLWLQPVRVASSSGLSRHDLRRIRELTFEHQVLFVERWNEYFAR